MPSVNRVIIAMLSMMSLNARYGSLKGNNGLACGPLPNGFFEHLCGSEVHGSAKEFRQFVLQPHHVEQGEVAGGIKLGHQINVVAGFPPGDGAEERKADNPRFAQFSGVFPQD